ncbi:ankyrin repeat-containing domain protein [Flagelloscypha sp. PMI_526]|nr:ankyrin repeat-containing domain protein [Flagelloscypha sp. PMI_526]
MNSFEELKRGWKGGVVRNDDYDQKYDPDRPGEETSHNARIWKIYTDEADVYDVDMLARLRMLLDSILVFAALFSAIVTAFIIETFQSLEPDFPEIAVSLLIEQIALIRTGGNVTAMDAIPSHLSHSTEMPTRTDMWVNGLFLTSLALSLVTAFLAVLMKQWLQEYRTHVPGSAKDQARIRHFRFRGLERWKLPQLVGFLPLLLHASLAIFFTGLIVLTVSHSLSLAVPIIVVSGFAFLIYFTTSFLSVLFPDSPFRNPALIRLTRGFILALAHSISSLPQISLLLWRTIKWAAGALLLACLTFVKIINRTSEVLGFRWITFRARWSQLNVTRNTVNLPRNALTSSFFTINPNLLSFNLPTSTDQWFDLDLPDTEQVERKVVLGKNSEADASLDMAVWLVLGSSNPAVQRASFTTLASNSIYQSTSWSSVPRSVIEALANVALEAIQNLDTPSSQVEVSIKLIEMARQSGSTSADTNNLSSVLHSAIIQDNIVVAQRCIQAGASPLSLLPKSTTSEYCKFLLELGVAVDALDPKGRTPLQLALESGDLSAVQALLNNGANIEYQGPDGLTPLMFCCRKNLSDETRLLISNGAPLNTRCSGKTALFIAVEYDAIGPLKILLEANADMDNANSQTLLMKACENQNILAARLLFNAGQDIKARDREGRTPLHFACDSVSSNESLGALNMATFLIERGATVDARDNYKASPLVYACDRQHTKVVALLLQLGADIHVRPSRLWLGGIIAHEEVSLLDRMRRHVSSDRSAEGVKILRMLEAHAITHPSSRMN